MNSKYVMIILIIILTLSIVRVEADTILRSTGVGLRGTYWNMSKDRTIVRVNDFGESATVNFGGAGCWLYLFSRMNETMFLEISIGAIGTVVGEKNNEIDDNIDATAMIPLLIGLRYNLMSPLNNSSIQPYFTFGAGPFWIMTAKVRDLPETEEVTLINDFERDAYLGGGFDFMLTSWCAFNFDLKYHFMDFNVHHERSGLEYGLGIKFMWGQFTAK